MLRVCGPNEAFVKSGLFAGNKAILSGMIIQLPFIQRLQRVDMNTHTIELVCPAVVTSRGVILKVQGTVQTKVRREEEAVMLAAEAFLDKSRSEINRIMSLTFEGHLRAICSEMSVEEINMDRKKFVELVKNHASVDVSRFGFEILSFTIREISSHTNYLHDLGRQRVARVKATARIGEAEARMAASVQEIANKQKERVATFENEFSNLKDKFDYQINQAEFNKQVFTEKAISELSGELQRAKVNQRIKEEEMQIQVVQKRQQTLVEEQEIQRTDQKLDSTVRRPAEAEAYRLNTIAEGNAFQIESEAKSKAQEIQALGIAEANVLKKKGEAEAKEMKARALAARDLTLGAFVDLMSEKLPETAKIVSDSLNGTDVTVIGSGDVSNLTHENRKILEQIPKTVTLFTGFDIQKEMNKV